MKLLLTSSGLDNRTIAKALNELTGRPPGETKIGFVSTAQNAESGNKDWYINQLLKLWRFGYNWIDIIDPSAANVDWQAHLDLVDVVFINGGNTFHLLEQTRKTGFDKWLEENKEKKVFVGGSAGSIIFSPTIEIAGLEPGPDENLRNITDLTGLSWVNFEIEPHCDHDRLSVVEKYASDCRNPVYAIDDQSAIKVASDKVEVASEGFWKVFNETAGR